MAKNILVIDGHPNVDSFNAALANKYVEQAKASGAIVNIIRVRDLKFDPNLAYGYQKRMDWEPDLHHAWDLIRQSDHLVFVHPLWWGGLPAILKGFIDRVFLPGLAFKYRENSVWWDKLLTGKTARIICTADQPYFYYWFVNGRPGIHQLKKMTLEFCGVGPVRVNVFGPIRQSTEKQRQKIVAQVAQAAQRDSR